MKDRDGFPISPQAWRSLHDLFEGKFRVKDEVQEGPALASPPGGLNRIGPMTL